MQLDWDFSILAIFFSFYIFLAKEGKRKVTSVESEICDLRADNINVISWRRYLAENLRVFIFLEREREWEGFLYLPRLQTSYKIRKKKKKKKKKKLRWIPEDSPISIFAIIIIDRLNSFWNLIDGFF